MSPTRGAPRDGRRAPRRASSTCASSRTRIGNRNPRSWYARDLLGGQRVGPDVAHFSSSPRSREAGRSPPVRCLRRRRRPTGSRSPLSEVPVIRCGVLRGMKQMSPGAEVEGVVADDLGAATADDHHHLLGIRVVVVLVRRAEAGTWTGRRRSATRRCARRRPSARRGGRTGPPSSCAASCRRGGRPAPLRRGAPRRSREERRRPPPPSPRAPRAGASGRRRAARRRRAFGSAPASSRPCSGSVRSSRPPTTTSTGLADLAEPAGKALRAGDRAALAHVVGGIVLEQQGPVLVEDRGSRVERRLRERRVLRPEAPRPSASSPMLSIRSTEASMRGARLERSASPPISTSAPRRRRAVRARSLSATLAPSECPTTTGRSIPSASSTAAEVVGPALERELLALELARAAGAAEVDADELCSPAPSASRTRFQSAPERPRPWTSTIGGPSPTTSTWISAPPTTTACSVNAPPRAPRSSYPITSLSVSESVDRVDDRLPPTARRPPRATA